MTARKSTTTKRTAKTKAEEFDFNIREDAAQRLEDFLADPDVYFVDSAEEAERLGVDQAQQVNNMKLLLHVLIPDDDYTKLRDHLQKTLNKRGVTGEMYEAVMGKLNIATE